ncbi:MAG: sigma-70 family RNA polymerase sigma factor [Acidobacteriota bacterium]
MPATVTNLRLVPKHREELEQLFQDHHDQIFRTAYRITGSTADAEDVLQTIFLRLVKSKEGYDLSPSPEYYLLRAAVNASLDLMRSRSRAKAVSLEEVTPSQWESPTLNPESQQVDRELRRLVQQSVTSLGERAAEIFVLRYFEGYSNREIAQMLGTSQLVVGVILHRARHQIRKAIGNFLEVKQ